MGSRSLGLFDVFRLQRGLEELFGVPRTNLLLWGAEHPALRDSIYEEAINVAWRLNSGVGPAPSPVISIVERGGPTPEEILVE